MESMSTNDDVTLGDVTLGEVYRVLLQVRAQTTITNGRLREAERTISVHTWAIGLVGAVAVALLGLLLAKAVGQ